MDEIDNKMMGRALELASLGWGKTNPNPMVGAVIVRDGIILSEGWHEILGGPHAEVMAFKKAREADIDVRGATMYVTLEPCSHFGRTPPCSLAIVQAGLGRVVAAMEDPNPLVSGKGLDHLRKAGIEVEVGVLNEEALKLNEIFIHYITHRRPFVLLKSAASLDGKTAGTSGESRWISGIASRALVHRWRAKFASILVGITTALQDDPLLTARDEKGGPMERQPLRIVLDGHLKLPLTSKLAVTATLWPVLLVCFEERDSRKEEELKKLGVEILPLKKTESGFDFKELMKVLYAREIDSLLVEGGSETSAGFLEAGLADKIALFFAPLLITGRIAPGIFGGEGKPTPMHGWKLSRLNWTSVGEDMLAEAYPQDNA